MRRARRLTSSSLSLAALLLAVAARPAAAQGNRDSLAAGSAAYDRADFAAAARLLPIGLDPAAGPRDAAWVTGVHKLADALLQTGDSAGVALWLAWAHRVAPGFAIDTLLFPPRVTGAIRAVRAALRAQPADSFVTTTWEFTGGDAAARRGVMRLGRAPQLQFGILGRPRADGGADNLGTVLEDERRTLAAGTYAVTFNFDGAAPFTVQREVLPGVTTIVTPRRPTAPVDPAVARADSAAVLDARLSSGGAASCLATRAAAYCWGSNAGGALGAGWTDSARAPVVVAGTQRFVQVTVGAGHACGLTAAGAAFCWGNGALGQLGNGATASSAAPVAVSGGVTFTALTAGAQHSCALSRSGAVFCWGAGAQGQLGHRASVNSPVPVAAATPAGTFTALAAGGQHTCALTSRGAAWCWGAGGSGQLGTGSTGSSNVPVAVAGDAVFKTLTAGGQHTCAIDARDLVLCWGSNGSGQLGNNTAVSASRPTPISDSTAFAQLVAGDAFTCGLTAAGAAWCWGDGASGQLGTGRTADSPRPALVVGGLDMRALSAGAAHACAATAERMVWCWGRNDAGQLGSLAGRTAAAPVPVVARPAPRAVPVGLRPRSDARDNFDDGNITAGVVWERDSVAGARIAVDSGQLVVARSNARGAFGAAGVVLPVRVGARDAAIRFDVRLVRDATPGCGVNCAAWPAVVRVRVRNRDFTESEVWYVFGPGGGAGGGAAGGGWSAGGITVVPREAPVGGDWLRRQRFLIQEAAPRADSIIEVAFGGIGTDFEIRYDNVVVPAPGITALVVRPDTARLVRAGDTLRLAAEARDAGGVLQPWVAATWSSSDTTVARVSAAGLVTAVGNGTAQIRAAAEDLTATARVTVRIVPPRRGRR